MPFGYRVRGQFVFFAADDLRPVCVYLVFNPGEIDLHGLGIAQQGLANAGIEFCQQGQEFMANAISQETRIAIARILQRCQVMLLAVCECICVCDTQ